MNILKWIQTSLKKLNTVRKLHMTQEEPIPTMSCTGVESQPAAAEKTSTGSQDSEPGRSSAGPTSASPSPKAPPNAAQAPAHRPQQLQWKETCSCSIHLGRTWSRMCSKPIWTILTFTQHQKAFLFISLNITLQYLVGFHEVDPDFSKKAKHSQKTFPQSSI